jgi:hypothetical protein
VTPQPSYDVFLCHNSRDKSRLRELNQRLRHEFGLTTFFDESELVGGRAWTEHIQRALASSKSCAICLGSNGWGPFQLEGEARPALERQYHDQSFVVIPVLLPGMNPEHMMVLKDFFEKTHWVDFREDWDTPASVRKLAAAIRGTAAFPEGKPELSPLRIRFDAFRWQEGARKDRSLLYRGSDLREAQVIVERDPSQLPADAQEFVDASVVAERNRRWITRAVTAAVIVTISVLLIITEYRRRNEQEARAEAFRSLESEKRARERETLALNNEKSARAAEQMARSAESKAKTVAEQQRDIAVRQRNLAYARFLVSEGERLVRAGQNRRASLFFVEALRFADSPEARGSLLTQTLKDPHLVMAGVPVPGGISALTSTSRGQVAVADREGNVSVVDFLPSEAGSSTYAGKRVVASLTSPSRERLVALEYVDPGIRLVGLDASGRLHDWLLTGATRAPAASTMLADIRESVTIQEALPGAPPFALSLSTVAIGSQGDGVRVFRIGGPGQISEIAPFSAGECFGVDLALDEPGRWLACYAQNDLRRSIRVWQLGLHKKLARQIDLPQGFRSPASIALSSDGQYLALGDSSDLFAIWKWQSLQSPPVIPQPHEVPQLGGRGFRPVLHLTFSQDSRLLSTIYNGRAHLWHVESGVQLAAAPHGSGDSAVTHIGLGRDLKSWYVGRGQAIGLVDLNPSVWQYWACVAAGGNLSPDEWNRFLPGIPYRCTCTNTRFCSGQPSRAQRY